MCTYVCCADEWLQKINSTSKTNRSIVWVGSVDTQHVFLLVLLVQKMFHAHGSHGKWWARSTWYKHVQTCIYIYTYVHTHTLTWVLSVAPRKTEAYFTSVLNVCRHTFLLVSMYPCSIFWGYKKAHDGSMYGIYKLTLTINKKSPVLWTHQSTNKTYMDPLRGVINSWKSLFFTDTNMVNSWNSSTMGSHVY